MITKKTFLSQLKQLVAIPTLSGNETTNAQILDLITSWAPKNATVKRYINNTAEILLLSTKKTDFLNPKIGYMAHADVVSAQPELWNMQVVNNKAYGRGVSDMKYAIPIGLSLLASELKKPKQKQKSLTIAITTDEELGGFNGAKYLAEKIEFKPEMLIVPDGGDNWEFVEKEKGFLRLELHTYGVSAHGSQPWNGKNAISDLVKVLTKIDEYYANNNSSPAWNTTCNIGIIEGGKSVNQVCNHAHAVLDIRHTEADSHESIQKTIQDIAEEAQVQIKIIKNTYGHSRFTSNTHPIAKQFITIMQKHAPKEIGITKVYGASDARHFSIYDTPVLMMKPNGGDIHQDTEWLNVSECIDFAKGLHEFIDTVE